ncbi:hypothetical protein PRK78_002465 [Emydomyces testavorans]|uniref:Uncharacterized protein n=1 Tax=Emydomyces testavorans TaxID=2070801 RepID=A0AAF0DG81_9EURO|nr:hypothetical protein PRK78_002465 [Emydomyces testavorans]
MVQPNTDVFPEGSKGEATCRPATVDDMIQWLWHDGFNRGIVGWVNDWPTEELFTDPTTARLSFSFPLGENESNQFNICDFDLNCVLEEVAKDVAHEEYIKRMIGSHKKLLPEAIREIDRQLRAAGVSVEEVMQLTTGAASDAYTKLARLQEAQRPFQVPERIQFRIVCDLPGCDWLPSDLYLKQICSLAEFIDATRRHNMIQYYLGGQIQQGPREDEFGNDSTSVLTTKEDGTSQRVLAYKLIPKDMENTWVAQDTREWIALCDESDFEKLKFILQEDKTKMAAICHELTLEKLKKSQQRGQEQLPEEFTLLKPQDMDMSLAGAFFDFDWTRLEKNPDGALLPDTDDEI